MKRRKDNSEDDRYLRQIVTTDDSGFILGILINLVSGLTEVLDQDRTLNGDN